MNQKLRKIAVLGYIAKGTVYGITGVLALFSAFNMGGQKAGKLEVIDYLENQPFGTVIIFILGLGLLCFALWRFIVSVYDPEDYGTDIKGLGKRVGFFVSGLVYASIGVFAILDALNITSLIAKGGGGGNTSLQNGTLSALIFIVVGAGLALKGVFQFLKIQNGDILKKFNLQNINSVIKRKTVKRIGYAGLISRGIVTLIIAYFFLAAGFNLRGNSSNTVKGTAQAFSFIQEQVYGHWLLGTIAIGLICYGLYMFTMAAYRQFDI
ncbi:DUF1206 domain-containing protein [Maribacter confluentis]|uniref:DUF1206 domain-containing protein n=1 Tax=Maribacter confluentis TaxID=1656093 RepID=A0ABT8RJJ2_9FLAO|nr:DUF1206 domain-containing protein [Maribacter confluentis]MDO1511178.1 DUF1206 domain-containing protein [Maribacter confluentis]